MEARTIASRRSPALLQMKPGLQKYGATLLFFWAPFHHVIRHMAYVKQYSSLRFLFCHNHHYSSYSSLGFLFQHKHTDDVHANATFVFCFLCSPCSGLFWCGTLVERGGCTDDDASDVADTAIVL